MQRKQPPQSKAFNSGLVHTMTFHKGPFQGHPLRLGLLVPPNPGELCLLDCIFETQIYNLCKYLQYDCTEYVKTYRCVNISPCFRTTGQLPHFQIQGKQKTVELDS
jgi:hypothetical protein